MRMIRPVWAKSAAALAVLAALTAAGGITQGATATPAPGTAAAAVPGGPDCGAAIYKADGTAWECTFADDFNGSALDESKWHVQTTAESGYSDSGACFVDDADNLSVSGGKLNLSLRKSGWPTVCTGPKKSFLTNWTSASVSTYGNFTQAYGRFEFRAEFPDETRQGLQSSIWMWPEANSYGPWPLSGEIDIAEWYSKYSDRAIPYLHYGWDFLDPNATNVNCLLERGVPHTFTLEWTPERIEISYDGQVCLSNTAVSLAGIPFNKPFMVALTQLVGSGNNKPNLWTPKVATMKVDWVRVWS